VGGGSPGGTGTSGGAGNGGSSASSGGAAQQGTGAAPSTGNTPGTGGGASNGNGGAIGGGGVSSGSGGNANGGVAGGGAGGGSAGTGGVGTGGAPDTSQSVLERNKHPNRDGLFVQPTLTPAVAAKLTKDTAFAPKLNGNEWASPLYLEQGPGGKGVFFVVTTTNDVYALDETTGATVWTKNIGDSPTSNGVNCGSIHPLGIIGTPVIDATARTIYVAGAIGTSSIDRHEVHAFSVDDGTEKPGFPVVVKGTSGSTTFTPPPQNQRSALSLVNGTLYVAYGGHVGDCGEYHGWVFGINTSDPTKMGGWATLGVGEGIWAPGGMVSDGNGVFAITGNRTQGQQADHMTSDSEELVHVTGLGVLNRSNQNIFFPSRWASMDSGDQDFGSSSPVLITVPGATPSTLLASVSKDGHFYLNDPANLGGMDGAKADITVGGRNSFHSALASYTTSKGRYVVMGLDGGGKCPAGGPSGAVVMSILIPPGGPPSVAWCATRSGDVPGPIVTTTDGTANPLVWYMSGSALDAVDGDTGKSVYSGSGANTCNGVKQWTSPIAVKGRIISSSDGTLCSWSAK
jgi:hypothetical protein